MSEAFDIPDPYTIPLEDIDVSNPLLYKYDAQWPYFERLRNEAPIHYCKDSDFGAFWSITKYDDIMDVEKDQKAPKSLTLQ